ncbi:hypothetical protein G6N05_02195 [Flavobacterium sp. F372]|uniref:DUF304 domain-containing protein n=1 Tax=Flavobacterium bernardetii TaxID=2813823 RepID=A0ABR7IVY4_9FLAO|nr:hypothetical protein [Flavobacterium bernardetii]MBC5833687.1 hypothetical protein [Flavobacterium bernardetii]NHF68920.1 hypothetical protein [Flavobacterium bernardetii]
MKTYHLSNNQIELYVQPSSKIGRGFLAFLGLIIFVMPIFGMVLGLTLGAEFHIMYLVGIGLSTLFAYHFYKLYHWNTCGKEVITLSENKVNYHADYGKFVSNKQEHTYETLTFHVKPVGYEKEQLGVLLFEVAEKKYLETVVILPLATLNEIVEKLK